MFGSKKSTDECYKNERTFECYNICSCPNIKHEIPQDVECHKTWKQQDVKCHDTCHVHSDSRGLVAKHKEIHKIIALTRRTGKCSTL